MPAAPEEVNEEEKEEEASVLMDEEIDRLYALPPHELRARFLDLHGPLGARFGPELHGPLPFAAAGEAPAALDGVAASPLLRDATLPPWRRALLAGTVRFDPIHSGCSGLFIAKLRKSGSCLL